MILFSVVDVKGEFMAQNWHSKHLSNLISSEAFGALSLR